MRGARGFFLFELFGNTRRCPWCGARDVHLSRHPLPLLSVLRWETWRCHRCGRRFPLLPGHQALPIVVPKTAPPQPAGAELLSLDRTLAELLRPGPIDGPDLAELPGFPAALEPRRKADDSR